MARLRPGLAGAWLAAEKGAMQRRVIIRRHQREANVRACAQWLVCFGEACNEKTIRRWAAKIDECATPALCGVLSKRVWDRWIPAGKLGAGIDRFTEPAGLNYFQGGLVLRVKAHHKADAQMDFGIPARRHHFFNIGNV